MKLTSDQLTALRQLAERATPGPWKAEGSYISAKIKGKRPNGEIIGEFRPSISDLLSVEQREANASHCAAFNPQTAKALLDEAAVARAVIRQAERLMRCCAEFNDNRVALAGCLCKSCAAYYEALEIALARYRSEEGE